MKQNLSTNIITRYFAKWSTPYKSRYSNMARVILPFSSIVNSSMEKAINTMAMRYRNTKLEVTDELHILDVYGEHKEIKTEGSRIEYKDGTYKTVGSRILENVGHYLYSDYSQFPSDGVILTESDIDWIEDVYDLIISAGQTKINHRFVKENRLYIKLPQTYDESFTVAILGYDKDFKYITEHISVRYEGVYETFKKFIYIDSISSPAEIILTNYVNCSIDHFVYPKHIPLKRITNTEGEFIFPYIIKDESSVYIYDMSSTTFDPLMQIDLDNKPKYLFVSNNSDVFSIDTNSWLTISKPTYNLTTETESNGSANNNNFIFLEDDENRVGTTIRCTVMAHDLARRSSSPNIRISVKNNGFTYYVNRYGQLVEDNNTWINTLNSESIITIPVICDNKLPYIFSVRNEDGELYQAISAQGISQSSMVLPKVKTMHLYDSELYVNYDGKIFKVKPVRHVYSRYSPRSLSLDSLYKEIRLK